MIILRDHSPIPTFCKGAVIALGNFDGLHRGHAAIIRVALEKAKALQKPVAIFTFEPHPRRILRPDVPMHTILTLSEKLRLLRTSGIDMVRVAHFTSAFSQTSAEEFITRILHGELHASHIITGENFFFGHNRGGNAHYLSAMAQKLGFGYTACPPVILHGEACSSSRIRALLEKGNVREAAELLGRPYTLSRRVQEGDKRGRALGFPTLNLIPGNILTPLTGVYAVRARIGNITAAGVANLGTRPTFDGIRLQLEVHLFDWQSNLYGSRVEIAFVDRIREEKKFENIELLKRQINEDCKQARRILSA